MDDVTYFPLQYDPKWKMAPADELRDALKQFREKHGIDADIVLCSMQDGAAVGQVEGVDVMARRYVQPHIWYPGIKPKVGV